VLPYLHPIGAGLTLVFLAYVGTLGLRARSDRRRARALLARHSRLAPILPWLVGASWIAGFLSTWFLRHDLELGASPHLRIGTALLLALVAGALTSRHMHRPTIRAIHPWFGLAALLLAAAQIFFGLQITP